MDVAGVTPEKVDAESIGFQLGPRMNALGRLEDATVAVDLLTTPTRCVPANWPPG